MGFSAKALPVERRRISLQVSLKQSELRLTLRDWGQGLSEAVRARLFDFVYTTRAQGWASAWRSGGRLSSGTGES